MPVRPFPRTFARVAKWTMKSSNVQKSAGDVEVWFSDGDAFTIHFPVSPFGASSFQVRAGSPGPVRPDVSPDQYYHFITDNTTGQSADPDVNVKP